MQPNISYHPFGSKILFHFSGIILEQFAPTNRKTEKMFIPYVRDKHFRPCAVGAPRNLSRLGGRGSGESLENKKNGNTLATLWQHLSRYMSQPMKKTEKMGTLWQHFSNQLYINHLQNNQS